jgi:hypothetical protein
MKLLKIKQRFIQSIAKTKQDYNEGVKEGLQFWKESLKSIKSVYWGNGQLHATPSKIIKFAHAVYNADGVTR